MSNYSPAFRIIKGGKNTSPDANLELENASSDASQGASQAASQDVTSDASQIALSEVLEGALDGTNARRETPLLKSSVTKTGAAAARRVRPQANVVSLTRLQVETYGKYWVDECRGAGHSERTTEYRADVIVKLCWFLDHREHPWCSYVELKEFLAYLLTGHNEPGFRWGNAKSPNCKKPVRPLTRHRYWRELSAWCKWMVKEGFIASSPMDQVDEPPKPKEQIPHLTQDQVEALLAAATRTKYPRRDIAILMLLLDTGLRAGELTGLTFATVDFYAADGGGQARVYGKGNKYRVVPFDRETAIVLRAYVRAEIGNLEEIAPSTPLFLAERGGASGRPLTTDGLRFLIYRLSDMAGIKRGVIKCSPHVFRHTCAYMALMGGANERSLMDLLGHTTLHMTHNYVALAQSDLQNQHKKWSPVAQLKRRKR